MARGRRPLLLLLVIAAVTPALVSIYACRTATQVTLEIRTHGFRCSELERVTIAVAGEPSGAEDEMRSGFVAAEVTSCESDESVGTLVVTPERSTGAIVVAASYAEARCVPPAYAGCIVARRAFAFVDHASLRLPITLEVSCKDVPCDAFSSCRSGQCVSSKAECSEDVEVCSSDAEPVFAPDGGTVPSDAPVVPDGPIGNDGGPPPDGAPDDGATDAAPDVVVPVNIFGNACPVEPAGKDCFDAGSHCCAYQKFVCASEMPSACASLPPLHCTGRKHCDAGQYCCGSPSPSSSAASQCTTGPVGCPGSSIALCNTAADCPPALPSCGGVYLQRFPGGVETLKKCVVP